MLYFVYVHKLVVDCFLFVLSDISCSNKLDLTLTLTLTEYMKALFPGPKGHVTPIGACLISGVKRTTIAMPCRHDSTGPKEQYWTAIHNSVRHLKVSRVRVGMILSL